MKGIRASELPLLLKEFVWKDNIRKKILMYFVDFENIFIKVWDHAGYTTSEKNMRKNITETSFYKTKE